MTPLLSGTGEEAIGQVKVRVRRMRENLGDVTV
jgi:hypothetical protein